MFALSAALFLHMHLSSTPALLTEEPPAPMGTKAQAADPAIRAALDAIYAGVSHAPGEDPDWEAFEGIFHPQATLVLPYAPGTEPEVQSVEQFLDFYRSMLAQPGAKDQGFVERCAGFQATVFGNVATVTSVYEARKTVDQEKPDRVGLDMVHLVRTGEGWKAVSLVTDFARADNPMPPALAAKRKDHASFSKESFFARLEKVKASGATWDPFLDRGNLHMGIYRLAAGAEDGQSPHGEDEVYYVVEGSASFTVDGETTPIAAGDVLFVAAHADHNFHDITEDLELLVFFARS